MSAAERDQATVNHAPAIRMRSAGEGGLVIEMGRVIAPRINAAVQRLAEKLSRKRPEGMIEVVPAYCSLLVHFDPLVLSRAALVEAVARIVAVDLEPEVAASERVRAIQIPVCYGGEFGPDLDYVAQVHGLTTEEVITIHHARSYRVYMVGFTPGFPYLGELSERIATPRLEKPRTLVPRGSVGIAGTQTGIYPVASPGGWRIIGRTPVPLFLPEAAHPFLFSPGDSVRFNPVTVDRYREIARQVEAGSYLPEVVRACREAAGV